MERYQCPTEKINLLILAPKNTYLGCSSTLHLNLWPIPKKLLGPYHSFETYFYKTVNFTSADLIWIPSRIVPNMSCDFINIEAVFAYVFVLWSEVKAFTFGRNWKCTWRIVLLFRCLFHVERFAFSSNSHFMNIITIHGSFNFPTTTEVCDKKKCKSY